MSRFLMAISILAALPALAGCVTAAAAHCEMHEGKWSCSGDVSGPEGLPGDTVAM